MKVSGFSVRGQAAARGGADGSVFHAEHRRGVVIAFRVQLNRDEAVTAGLCGLHVVAVHADDLRAIYRRHAPSAKGGAGLRMSVGGLQTEEGVHVSWSSGPLTVGDEIRISVVEVSESEISPPIRQNRAAPENEGRERERLAYLLEKYGAPAER
jgi:hypothetical protein